MPWPKGVPRVGYVRKDGKPHNKKGEGRAADIKVVRPDEPKYTQTKTDKDTRPRVIKDVKLMVVSVDAKPIHGGTSRAIIEVCPNCSYAYADGGYCSECGWTTWTGAKPRGR